MELETILSFVNSAMSVVHGRALTDAELALVKGAWQGQSYGDIARQWGYNSSDLTRTIGPTFWNHLSDALGTKVTKSRFRTVLEQQIKPSPGGQAPRGRGLSGAIGSLPNQESVTARSIDWGEAPDVNTFYGRQSELSELTQWLSADRCRVVGVFGMGGIGKTSLTAKFVETLATSPRCPFTHIFWRSLRNAPSLTELVEEAVPFFSNQQDTNATLKRLLYWLRQSSCLLILDNLETVLQDAERAGSWRTGYDDYGQMIQLLAETRHQSSVILTSREKPAIVGTLEGIDSRVRSLQLGGSPETAQSLLNAKGLIGSALEKQTLGDRLGNSPLVLKIVATSIQSLFDGDIASFLAEDTLLFNGAKRVLDQQFERLTPLETKVMYWLAINRDWTNIADLMADIYPPCSKPQLLETLESLTWRSLIECRGKTYTQQPVVMEYVTEQLVTQISEELIEFSSFPSADAHPTPALPLIRGGGSGSFPPWQGGIKGGERNFFDDYALIKTTVKDNIRDSQIRLILDAVGDRLMAQLLNKKTLVHHLQTILQSIRQQPLQSIRQQPQSLTGYSIGNLLNLCLYLGLDLTHFDCSDCTLRQVYFQGQQGVNVNLSRAILQDCRFTETFGGILSLACSPDNTMMAFGDAGGTLCLWQLESRLESRSESRSGSRLESRQETHLEMQPETQPIFHQAYLTLDDHTDGIAAITWHPDSKILATGSSDATVRIWDKETGQCLSILRGHRGPVWGVDWSPDGKMLATGSSDRTIKLWDVETGDCLATLMGHQNLVWSVAWHPNGDTLASSSEDCSIRQWDVRTHDCVRVFPLAEARVRRVLWSPDGTILASGSADHCIRLWDGATGTLIRRLSLPVIDGDVDSNNDQGNDRGPDAHSHKIWVDSLVWSPDGQVLASGGSRIIYLWAPQTGECMRTFHGHQEHIWGLSWTADSQTLVSGSHDQTVRLWNVAEGYCRRTIQGYVALIKMVAWSPDGQKLATVGTEKTVRIWDVATGHCDHVLTGHRGWSFSASWSPTQPIVASSSSDTTIKLWDRHTGQCLKTLSGHRSWVWSVAWNCDGTLLASGSSTNDLTVRVWDVATGDCLHVLYGHQSWIWWVVWHPHRPIFATAGDDRRVILWDATTGECLKTLQDDYLLAMSIAWSPDGKWIATTSITKAVRLWNVDTGVCEQELPGHQGIVWAIAWSPDGQWIASASDNDYAVNLWEVDTGTRRHVCLGHEQRIWSLAWSPSNATVASSSQDGTIRLWDVQTGNCLKILRGDRPYEGMTITDIQGITEAQKQTLTVLGAIDEPCPPAPAPTSSPGDPLGVETHPPQSPLVKGGSSGPPPLQGGVRGGKGGVRGGKGGVRGGNSTLPMLTLQLFGGFQMTDKTGAGVDLTSKRSQALFSYLILNRAVAHPRQRLAFLLYPDSSESQGRSALRKDLFNLRHALLDVEDYLRIDTKTIQWNADAEYHLDVAEFETGLDHALQLPDEAVLDKQQELEQAIATYTGLLLPSQDYEWVIQERERLHQRYLSSLDQLVRLLEQQENTLQAIHYAQQLLQQEPLRESTYQALMRLHEKRGDRAVALQIYHQCMTLLRDELGIDPSPTTQALYQTLLNE